MKPVAFSFILLLFSLSFSAQTLKGRVETQGVVLSGVLVVNVTQDTKSQTRSDGVFEVSANPGDELRFVKSGYDRKELIVSGTSQEIVVSLVKIPTLIEEVHVNPVRLTGNLHEDSKNLSRISKKEQIRRVVGLPGPVANPRQHATTSAKEVLLPMLLGSLNIQAAYDLISGDGRRRQSLYDFQDAQRELIWLKVNIDPYYFRDNEIPENRIDEFLQFAVARNPKIKTYIKAKNGSGAQIELSEPMQVYKERLSQSSAKEEEAQQLSRVSTLP